jgi:transcriptional regulator with XRE-family HTH domain
MELSTKYPYTYLDAISDRFRVLFEGKTHAEIAELTGVSKNMVGLILGPKTQNLTMEILVRMVAGAGLDLTNFFEQIEYPDPDEEIPANVPRYTEAQKEWAVLSVNNGTPISHIAAALGASWSTVKAWTQKKAAKGVDTNP